MFNAERDLNLLMHELKKVYSDYYIVKNIDPKRKSKLDSVQIRSEKNKNIFQIFVLLKILSFFSILLSTKNRKMMRICLFREIKCKLHFSYSCYLLEQLIIKEKIKS